MSAIVTNSKPARLVVLLLASLFALASLVALTGGSASAVSNASAAASDDAGPQGSMTKGTKVSFRNDTGKTVWIREWVFNAKWSEYLNRISPGDWYTQADDSKGVDDVEFRIFRSYEDAKDNSNYLEVDAENPPYHHPYMVVDWHEHRFNVNETYEYRVMGDKVICWSKRYEDSEKYKEFHLHMKTIW